jgi:hypothetical protein
MLSPSREAIERYEARILAYEPRATRDQPRPRVRTHRRLSTPRHRARRIVVLTALILLLDLVVSFWSAMGGPSNVSFGVRAIEWLRDNGAAGMVSDIESAYYSLNAPATGGPPLKRLPRVGAGAQVRAASYAPPPIPPVVTPALPGEGQWRGTGPLVGAAAPVLLTTFRS